jgi:YegS/Rv2252/BmrU family lipid kinase
VEAGAPVGVILNPRANAGRALRLLPRLAAALEATGRPYDIHVTAAPGDATDAARRFAGEGLPLVLAVGGDGTVNEVANGLVGQPATRLGIVPAGRGADFVRTLGGRRRPLKDLAGLFTAPSRLIDLGLATFGDGATRVFVNVAGVGFDAEVARRAARSRLPGRHTPYLAALAGAVIGYRNQAMTVEVGEERVTGTMRAVLIANGRFFGGGFEIVPDASLDDGLLDLALIGNIGRLDLLRTVPSLYRGQHTNHPLYRHQPVCSVHVSAPESSRIRVELDGELAGNPPVTISVLPGALWVAT